MFRLSYFAGDEKDAIEFEIGDEYPIQLPDMQVQKGAVSDIQLEKWNGAAFAAVDVWDPEYYDITEKFFQSMPSDQNSKKLIIKNAYRSGNLATVQIDELVLQNVAGDLEFYPILAHLKGISFIDLDFGTLNAIFMDSLAESDISSLVLSNISPIEPFYRLFLPSKTKNLKHLINLTIERQVLPKILPNTLTSLCLRQMKSNFKTPFPKLPFLLTCLDLSQNNIHELTHVAAAIRHCTNLAVLILDGNNFHVRELGKLFQLTHLRQLKNISAVGVEPPQHKDISLLLQALEKNTSLVGVDISPAHLDTRLRNRLQINCLLAEPDAVKTKLRVTENSDGVTFNVDPHSLFRDVADFFVRPFAAN